MKNDIVLGFILTYFIFNDFLDFLTKFGPEKDNTVTKRDKKRKICITKCF